MEDAPKADPETALALSTWATSAVAMLIADLHDRRLVSDDFVEHLSDELLKLEAELPIEASDAISHVDWVLSGDWLRPRGKP